MTEKKRRKRRKQKRISVMPAEKLFVQKTNRSM